MAVVIGSEEPDTLDGTTGDDIIRGLEGDDYLRPLGGFDRVFGGAGNDTVESYEGSKLLYGGAGNDTLNSGTGADALYGGGGDDRLYGGDGFDQLLGEAGSDRLSDSAGGDSLDGGKGIDLLDFRHSGVFVFVPGATIITQLGTTAVSFERISIFGGNDADEFTGGRFDDQLRGWQGNDILNGRGGDDFIIGDNGADTMYGGAGDDYITGGGHDDLIYGGAGNDTLRGGQLSDLFQGHDWFDGGMGADTFLGGGSSASITFENSREGVIVNLDTGQGTGGEAEGDLYQTGVRNLVGSNHADTLIGAVQQYGLDGDDFLVQQAGTSLMEGGAGIDTFVFRYNTEVIFESVTITDFDQAAGEKIDLTLADALPGGEDDAFTFLGTGALTGAAGELRYASDGAMTTVELTLDASGFVHRIFLTGDLTLSAADFLL